MSHQMILSVNLAMIPGVELATCSQEGQYLRITVTGGHRETVAKMILQCIPPNTLLAGKNMVEVEGHKIRFNHEDQSSEAVDNVIPLPLLEPEEAKVMKPPYSHKAKKSELKYTSRAVALSVAILAATTAAFFCSNQKIGHLYVGSIPTGYLPRIKHATNQLRVFCFPTHYQRNGS